MRRIEDAKLHHRWKTILPIRTPPKIKRIEPSPQNSLVQIIGLKRAGEKDLRRGGVSVVQYKNRAALSQVLALVFSQLWEHVESASIDERGFSKPGN
ncbi:MAG: hypothetical protein WBH75_13950 [Thermoanaerobaculia bacterium]